MRLRPSPTNEPTRPTGSSPHPSHFSRTRILLQGGGVAALLLFPIYGPVISNLSSVRMHAPGPLTDFVLSIAANLALVAIVSALLGAWMRSSARQTSLRFLLPGLVLASVAEAVLINARGYESLRLWVLVAIGLTALMLVLHAQWPRGERLLLQLSSATLMGLGFFCLVVMLQLVRLAMWRPAATFTGNSATQPVASAIHRRVIWILFDELSYQQVFGQRYAGLQLANFDRLRQSSTLFTDAQPVGTATEIAVPSILLGQQVSRVRSTFSNHLEVAFGSGAMHPFDAAATPFAVARRNGLTTAVAGWYNPYCGMLAPYLNQCYWTNELATPSVFAGEGFWRNLIDPWMRYAVLFHSVRQRKSLSYRVQAYTLLLRHSRELLQQPGPDFIFLHLPLPHPPGVYNRQTQRMDTSGTRSYVDNLALADKTLGQILAILQASPEWSDTSIVICGDHSWRIPTWKHSRYWSAEDEAASRGEVFDQRPLILVHLAGQTTPETVSTPYSLLGVHTILDDLVAGKPPLQTATARAMATTP